MVLEDRLGRASYLDGVVELAVVGESASAKSLYRGHRVPPEIISHAVWRNHRFAHSILDVEDLLAERGVTGSHEAIRLGVSQIRSRLCSKPAPPPCQLGEVWHLDEVFMTIRGRRRNLWKAVGQDGDDLDIAECATDRSAAPRQMTSAGDSVLAVGNLPPRMPVVVGRQSEFASILLPENPQVLSETGATLQIPDWAADAAPQN